MSSFLPDFLLPNRAVERPTVDVPDVSDAERRWRRGGLVALGVLVVAVAVAVVLVLVGALGAGTLGTVLAVAFGGFVATGLLVDLVMSLRVRRSDDGVRPGLRAASYLYLSALVCVVAAFAFLTS